MQKKRFKTVWRVLLTFVVVVSALFLAFLWWIWNPQTSNPQNADAIMVFSYRDDRMQKGRELAAEGVSDELIVSRSKRVQKLFEQGKLANSGSPWFEVCGKEYPNYTANCIVPSPNTTRGEAAAMARLANAEGWDSIVLVTEPSHLRRATAVTKRCFDGTVYPVASESKESLGRTFYRSFYEAGAYIRDFLGGNQCL